MRIAGARLNREGEFRAYYNKEYYDDYIFRSIPVHFPAAYKA